MYLRIGKYNVTQLVQRVQTQGTENSCGRSLTVSILQPSYDSTVPVVAVNIGDTVTFKADGHEFYGIVFDVQRKTSSETVEVIAYDMCIYAKKTKVCFKARNTTPETVAKSLFEKNGIPHGEFESTNFCFTHTFYNASIYDAVMTGYGYAAAEIGERYYMCAEKTKVCVRRKGAYVAAIIKPKQNLMDASYKVSAQNAVNRVEIRDEDGKLLKAYMGDDTSYGICTEIIKKSDNASREAKKLLQDRTVEKTATVTCLGNPLCTTGRAVFIEEPHTGMYGLFFIDGDTHTWENGLYTNKLTLNFQNMMSKESIYKAEKSSSGNSSGSSSESEEETAQFIWKPDGTKYN